VLNSRQLNSRHTKARRTNARHTKAPHGGLRLLACATYMVGVAALATAAAPAPAAAQSLFDFFFNAARRPPPPPSAAAYADTQSEPFGARPSDPAPRAESGPAVSYCVRLCDGRFFPIQRSAATPVEICNSFCPAARTKVFSGGSIDHAVARDGSRYTELGTAFVYRDRVVPGCTCNGKDAFGLVNMKASEDPTLRRGDVVATEAGFVAYNGSRNRTADFTPINSASGVPAEAKRQLAQTRIAPKGTPAPTEITAGIAASPARDGNERQVQVER
jgi:Protein of unknown function (DUF2865)